MMSRECCYFKLSQLLFCLLLSACQSKPHANIQVSKAYPPGHCKEIGQVIGNAHSKENARELAIDDMKYNASRLDATYIRLIVIAAYGRSARGIAYRCR